MTQPMPESKLAEKLGQLFATIHEGGPKHCTCRLGKFVDGPIPCVTCQFKAAEKELRNLCLELSERLRWIPAEEKMPNFSHIVLLFATRTCSECGCLSGPTGLAGLSVRQWRCPCGAEHDRDVNAARNTLIAAAGIAVEVAHV